MAIEIVDLSTNSIVIFPWFLVCSPEGKWDDCHMKTAI